jgi:hypothetical protein
VGFAFEKRYNSDTAFIPLRNPLPGQRQWLEGAITIAWKNGKTETFKEGSSYFEAPNSNHPIGQMSARNAADGRTRVLIFELLPKE